MDPNENLREMLELAEQLCEGRFSDGSAARLAELVLALDGWLHREGFAPERWARTCVDCGARVAPPLRCGTCHERAIGRPPGM